MYKNPHVVFFFFFFFLRQILTVTQAAVQCCDLGSLKALSPGFTYTILLPQPPELRTTGACHHAQLILVFSVETGFHRVSQDDLDLLTS